MAVRVQDVSAGGGTRTSELTLPGVLHDDCAASHPTGVISPFSRRLDWSGTAWSDCGPRSICPPLGLVDPRPGQSGQSLRALDR
jgi:hypothetical protein